MSFLVPSPWQQPLCRSVCKLTQPLSKRIRLLQLPHPFQPTHPKMAIAADQYLRNIYSNEVWEDVGWQAGSLQPPPPPPMRLMLQLPDVAHQHLQKCGGGMEGGCQTVT